MSNSETFHDFTVLDWIGIIYTVVNIVSIFFFTNVAARIGGPYTQAGGFGGELSVISIITLNPWFLTIAGIVSVSCFSLLWHKSMRFNLKRKRIIIATSFAVTVAATALCVVGIVLPMVKMLGAVG